MKKIISLSIALTALVASTSQGSEGRELLVSAPVQQLGAGTVTVLGRDFEASTDNLAIGEVVNVYGLLNPDGSIVDTVIEGTKTFGGSGDSVFIKGVVSDTNPLLGSIQVNGATVDYTGQLGSPDFSAPVTGDVVALAGSQPLVKGVVLASAFGQSAYAAAVTGGGFRVAAMTGGGGVRTEAMTGGGGVRTEAMTGGGGVRTEAMTGGGGVRTEAMTGGGGVRAEAMTGGGGVRAEAMTGGGGVRAEAMTGGGGVRAEAMTGGGGVRAEAMTGGGGVRAEAMTGGGGARSE